MTPPVSGCRSRRRSSAVSSVPTTSSMRGPRGSDRALMFPSSLQYHACAGQVLFVANRQVMANDATVFHHFFKLGMKLKAGLARPVLNHADTLQRHWIPEAGTHRLGKGLLRSETVGDEEHRLDRFLVTRPFQRGQHALGEALPVLLEQPGDSPRLHDVDSNSVNHREALIRAFISRTACPIPTNIERATME